LSDASGPFSSWGRIVAGAVLIVVGVIWLLEAAGIIAVSLDALAPLALIVIGIGLVVGSRRGSYPLLIILGVVLTVFLAASSEDELSAFGGEHYEQPTDSSQLHPYRLGAGTLTVDLTALDLDSETYDVDVRVGTGRIRVFVPEGVPVRVVASAGAGSLRVLGETSAGFSPDVDRESPDWGDDEPRFDLRLRIGVGTITVTEREGVQPLRQTPRRVPDRPDVPEFPDEFPFDNNVDRF